MDVGHPVGGKVAYFCKNFAIKDGEITSSRLKRNKFFVYSRLFPIFPLKKNEISLFDRLIIQKLYLHLQRDSEKSHP